MGEGTDQPSSGLRSGSPVSELGAGNLFGRRSPEARVREAIGRRRLVPRNVMEEPSVSSRGLVCFVF